VDGLLLAYVADESVRFTPFPTDPRGDALELVRPTRHEHDPRSPSRQRTAQCRPQPPAASGDQRRCTTNIHAAPPACKLAPSIQRIDILANPLADGYPLGMGSPLAARLARNIKQLREARDLTQEQMARLSGIPRATWGHLESGSANPTLAVLDKVATALQVPIEELTAAPRASGRLYPRDSLAARKQGDGLVRKLLPDPIPGMLIDRMEIPAGGRITGAPHMPGTREYLTCEAGEILLAAGGEQWRLRAGDVVVFKGDQRHSYTNAGQRAAVGYSVVVLARV